MACVKGGRGGLQATENSSKMFAAEQRRMEKSENILTPLLTLRRWAAAEGGWLKIE